MTALTLYMTNTVDTTLSSSNTFVTVSGGGQTNKNTQVGKFTGWGKVNSQGTTNPWPQSGSSLSPDGTGGWLWDDTTLADGAASFSPGTWSVNVSMHTNAGSITANVHVFIYRRASNGVFSTITSMSLSTQSITTTNTIYALSSTTTSASTPFSTGDLLFAEVQLNITTNTTNSNTTLVEIKVANSSTLGNSGTQIVTPGYTSVTPISLDATSRFRLSSAKVFKNAQMRLRLSSSANSVLKDAQMRMRLIGRIQRDAAFRLRTVASGGVRLNAPLRLRLKSAIQKDAAIRFRLSIYSHSALFPPAVRRTGCFAPAVRRQTV